MSAQWFCNYCGVTNQGGTTLACASNPYHDEGHAVCFKCFERVKTKEGLAEIVNAIRNAPMVRCPDRLPEHELALLALGCDGDQIPVYEFVGGPSDGEIMAVDRHHNEMVVPVTPKLVSFDLGMDGVVPKMEEIRAIYRKKMCPDGRQVFECENDAELRREGLIT